MEANHQREVDKFAARVTAAHYELFLEGWYRGKRPFGYNLKKIVVHTNRYGQETSHTTLELHPTEAEGVRLAFATYAEGKTSFLELCGILNEAGYRSTSGRRWTTDAIKDLLSNRLYISYTTYQQTSYDSKRKRTYENDVQYARGKHEPIISQALFDAVQAMRQYRTQNKRKTAQTKNSYLLVGLVWCNRCHTMHERGLLEGDNPNFGKMQSHTHIKKTGDKRRAYYSCEAYRKGYSCPQGKTRTDAIDSQVLSILYSLTVPTNWRKRLVNAVATELGDANREARIAALREEMQRWNVVFASGYVDRAAFEAEQSKRQTELAKLTMADELDTYVAAASLIENFKAHFDACKGQRLSKSSLRPMSTRCCIMAAT